MAVFKIKKNEIWEKIILVPSGSLFELLKGILYLVESEPLIRKEHDF